MCMQYETYAKWSAHVPHQKYELKNVRSILQKINKRIVTEKMQRSNDQCSLFTVGSLHLLHLQVSRVPMERTSWYNYISEKCRMRRSVLNEPKKLSSNTITHFNSAISFLESYKGALTVLGLWFHSSSARRSRQPKGSLTLSGVVEKHINKDFSAFEKTFSFLAVFIDHRAGYLEGPNYATFHKIIRELG